MNNEGASLKKKREAPERKILDVTGNRVILSLMNSAWTKTDAGKATMAMYAAAEKAGGTMLADLHAIEAEIVGSGASLAFTYEREVEERKAGTLARTEAARERARKWLARYVARGLS
jgi:hypothetical protein